LRSPTSARTAKPLRAAIYARYSSDEQRPESIEDQILKCRRYCDAMNWDVVSVYSDAAITGATIMRPQYQRLLQDAESGIFDIVVVEAVDRLSRRLADLANFHDIVDYRKVKLYATDRGEINGLMVGLLGAMAQAFLEDLRAKTKRGLTGKIIAGLSAGSIGYGYKVDPETKGKRIIIAEEAEVVRRIFEEYANGASPRAIAAKLNAEGVPGPSDRHWIDTTIRGQVDRGTGILNNVLYIGRIVWNRVSYTRSPKTGKRLARRNPQEEWEEALDDSLRIVDDALWQQVKEQQNVVRTVMGRDNMGVALNRVHRAQHLLSGLIFCGECASPFAMRDAKVYGCSNFRSKGMCTQSVKVKREDLEGIVGDAIRNEWMNDDFLASARTELLAERLRLLGSADGETAKLNVALKRTEAQIANTVNAIAEVGHNPALLKKLSALEADEVRLKTDLEAFLKAIPPEPAEIAGEVEATVQWVRENIERDLSNPHGPNGAKLREVVRGMIERITIMRHESGAIEVGLRGRFAGVMHAAGLVEQHSLAYSYGGNRLSKI
jgi:site-specific DNA recombinase